MASSKDVAKRAGVSQTTVSRVLNNPESVKEKTRLKVQQAIAELGYIPDQNARALVSNKSNTIALIAGPLHNPFYVDATEEIVNHATAAGYRVNVHFSDGFSDSVYEAVLANRVDGLIVSSILLDDPIVQRLQNLQLPFISFNRRHATWGNFVEMDNFAAGKLAFEHVFELGHRNILWVGGNDAASTFQQRFAGFRHAWQQAKNTADGKALWVQVVNYKQSDKPDLHSMLTGLLNSQRMPSAICAATDAIALQLINTLIALGLRVPEDVSVMGIDNVAVSGTPLIQLSTIGTADGTRLGLSAIQILLEMLEAGEPSAIQTIQQTLPVALFLRSSTRSVL